MSGKQQALKVVEDIDPIDPLRTEISVAIADRSARQEDVTSARKTVDRLTAVIEKGESKRSLARVKAEEERSEHIAFLAETAKSRAPETVPLSPARKALAEVTEEAAAAQAALDVAQSRRAEADAALAAATTKVGTAISNLMAHDLQQRIAAAKRAQDEFIARVLILDEIAPDETQLPQDISPSLRLLRLAQQNLLPFDHDVAFGPARAWKDARKSLQTDCNAALPD